mmetsp:Transcript_10804/g.20978  ORF Transcript_10804/g.20978 Transcript_10804/m.20978 type:complete len:668 (+) Transcript_10804:105-2108(+)
MESSGSPSVQITGGATAVPWQVKNTFLELAEDDKQQPPRRSSCTMPADVAGRLLCELEEQDEEERVIPDSSNHEATDMANVADAATTNVEEEMQPSAPVLLGTSLRLPESGALQYPKVSVKNTFITVSANRDPSDASGDESPVPRHRRHSTCPTVGREEPDEVSPVGLVRGSQPGLDTNPGFQQTARRHGYATEELREELFEEANAHQAPATAVPGQSDIVDDLDSHDESPISHRVGKSRYSTEDLRERFYAMDMNLEDMCHSAVKQSPTEVSAEASRSAQRTEATSSTRRVGFSDGISQNVSAPVAAKEQRNPAKRHGHLPTSHSVRRASEAKQNDGLVEMEERMPVSLFQATVQSPNKVLGGPLHESPPGSWHASSRTAAAAAAAAGANAANTVPVSLAYALDQTARGSVVIGQCTRPASTDAGVPWTRPPWELAAVPCLFPFPVCANAPPLADGLLQAQSGDPLLPWAGEAASEVAVGQPEQQQRGHASSPPGSTAPGMGTVARGTRRTRLWAHIHLHMMVPGFDLVPRLIGRKGCNMRKIAESTGAKIRIRGRGSGHLEIDGQFEAPTPLMVAVTTDKMDEDGFRAAVAQTIEELKNVEIRFRHFCEQKNIKHEGPCYSIGSIPDKAKDCLGPALLGLPRSTLGSGGRSLPTDFAAVGSTGAV